MITGLGLDGCRGGWVLARLGDDGRAECSVLPRIEALDAVLAARSGPAPRCLIDIPVGLPLSGARPVDAAAKALLAGAASSVFTIPPRPVFDALDFSEGQRLARDSMGKGFSIQAWNILPKIREVDLWLRRRGPHAPPLRESHPELAFRGLARIAGMDPLTLGKKATKAGEEQRKAVLAGHGVDVEPALADRSALGSNAPKVDDVLDALALATLARFPEGDLATVPEQPACDPLGLPMEMVVPRILLEG